jgi:hypothetical protein
MDEDLEQKLVRLVADLSPEEYERRGPALRELGLALAELREVQLEVRNVRGIYEQALEDLGRAEERAYNALQLWEDAL